MEKCILHQLRLIGQWWMLHEICDVDDPAHCLPPCAGLGFVQERVLRCNPPPQVLEHDPEWAHPLQPPFTAKKDSRCTVDAFLGPEKAELMLATYVVLRRTCENIASNSDEISLTLLATNSICDQFGLYSAKFLWQFFHLRAVFRNNRIRTSK